MDPKMSKICAKKLILQLTTKSSDFFLQKSRLNTYYLNIYGLTHNFNKLTFECLKYIQKNGEASCIAFPTLKW